MKTALCLAALAASAVALDAQSMISAKSGLLNYTEGQVSLGGKEVRLKGSEFPQMKQGDELRTADGRAEALLGPGVFLRLGENSAVKMVSDRLTDTRLEFEAGSAIVEVATMEKDSQLTFTFRDATISMLKDGLYRLDSEPAQLRVYDGEARVVQGGQAQSVRKSRMLLLDSASVAEKFDNRTGDALYRWAKRRSEYLTVANLSAAKYVHDRGLSYASSSWVWNPWYGAYTFLPLSGGYRSFWGNQFFSPVRFYAVFQAPKPQLNSSPVGSYNHSQGYSTMAPTVSGTSGTMAASAPSTAASQASSAPISRGTGSAGGRTR